MPIHHHSIHPNAHSFSYTLIDLKWRDDGKILLLFMFIIESIWRQMQNFEACAIYVFSQILVSTTCFLNISFYFIIIIIAYIHIHI